jgi:hypothetical protein
VSATCSSGSGRSALLVASLEALTDAGLRPVHSETERAARVGSVRPR